VPKADGLLAILAGGKEGRAEKGSESRGSEPGSAKARALKAMWSAMQAGDFDAAAEEFQAAYDACAMGESEESTEAEAEDEYEG
jgi:hypothetical protein